MTEYTVEIQASNGDDIVWQALMLAENVETGAWGPNWSAEDVARWTADNQTITEDALNGWRVCVWLGADADTGMEPAAVYYPAGAR